jgi:hypothetical protein
MNDKLIEEYFDYAMKTAKCINMKYLDEDERQAIATDVLIKCSENYDESKKTNFRSYLVQSIKFELGQKNKTAGRRYKKLSFDESELDNVIEPEETFNRGAAQIVIYNLMKYLTKEEQEIIDDLYNRMKYSRPRLTKEERTILLKMQIFAKNYYNLDLNTLYY